jgi:hypothetical protein
MGVLWEKSRSFLGATSELPRSYHGRSKRTKYDLKEQIVGCQPLKIDKRDLPLREISPAIGVANIDIFYEKQNRI